MRESSTFDSWLSWAAGKDHSEADEIENRIRNKKPTTADTELYNQYEAWLKHEQERPLNGFEITAQGYRKLAQEGKISRQEAGSMAFIYDSLGSIAEMPEGVNTIADSTIVNEIFKGYVRKAVNTLVNAGTLDEEQGQAVKNEFSYLLDTVTADEINEA